MNSDRSDCSTLRWWLDSARNCNQRNHFLSKFLIRDTHDDSFPRISNSARFWTWMKSWETNHYCSWVSRASETDTRRFSCVNLSCGRNFRHNWFKWFEFRALSNHHRRVGLPDRSEFIKGTPKTIPDPVGGYRHEVLHDFSFPGHVFPKNPLCFRLFLDQKRARSGKQRSTERGLVWYVMMHHVVVSWPSPSSTSTREQKVSAVSSCDVVKGSSRLVGGTTASR